MHLKSSCKQEIYHFGKPVDHDKYTIHTLLAPLKTQHNHANVSHEAIGK